MHKVMLIVKALDSDTVDESVRLHVTSFANLEVRPFAQHEFVATLDVPRISEVCEWFAADMGLASAPYPYGALLFWQTVPPTPDSDDAVVSALRDSITHGAPSTGSSGSRM